MCKRLYERDICQSTFKMPKSVNKSTNNLSSASNKTWNSTMRQASSKQKEIRKSNRSKMYEEQHKNNYSLFLCLCWLFSKELFPVFHFTHYILTLCISPQRDVVSQLISCDTCYFSALFFVRVSKKIDLISDLGEFFIIFVIFSMISCFKSKISLFLQKWPPRYSTLLAQRTKYSNKISQLRQSILIQTKNNLILKHSKA